MGSSAAFDQDEFTVLITGFGPFKENYPRNPSWEIVSDLPEYLPPLRRRPSSPHASIARSAGQPIPPVRLLVYPEPIRVSYRTVRPLVPRLWTGGLTPPAAPPAASAERIAGGARYDDDAAAAAATAGEAGIGSKRPIDLCVHVGMAGARMQYSLERRGHRDGYKMRDVDGELLRDDEKYRHPKEEGGDDPEWEWYGVPDELKTDVDVEDVLQRWRVHAPPTADVRISEDAGRYLCDFIYFSSLAHLYKAGKRRRVVFLHVPSSYSESLVRSGREILLQLIRSIVESEVTRMKEDVEAEEATAAATAAELEAAKAAIKANTTAARAAVLTAAARRGELINEVA